MISFSAIFSSLKIVTSNAPRRVTWKRTARLEGSALKLARGSLVCSSLRTGFSRSGYPAISANPRPARRIPHKNIPKAMSNLSLRKSFYASKIRLLSSHRTIPENSDQSKFLLKKIRLVAMMICLCRRSFFCSLCCCIPIKL